MLSSEDIKKKARVWLGAEFDQNTRNEVKFMLENDEKGLVDAFYRDLEFGTGGLRGIMGTGTNRMNIYTVGMATQGLANYIKKQKAGKPIKVAIAHDSRNNSRLYAETTANIFAANGFEVFLYESLRPTPSLSFAIRHYKCDSGVVITASHNPPEYNGYKAYWDDGGQVVAPHDKGIIDEVRNIISVNDIKRESNKTAIKILGKETDDAFLKETMKVRLDSDAIYKNSDLKIVYTPVHGTGVVLVPAALRLFGFKNIFNVPEQDVIDGDFPTVKSPNPEETATLRMAIDKAVEIDAELVMATDPDGDRLGIAVKNLTGEFVLLNGNQTCALLIWYILYQYEKKEMYAGNEYIIKTIVTTDLVDRIANHFDVKCYNVLTGFKFFAELIKKLEGKEKFIGGGEESYGFLAGDHIRDKDAVSACALIAEVAAWAKNINKSLYELLIEIYLEHGMYKEKLTNVVRGGKEGADEIRMMMESYRNKPPASINSSKIIMINDYGTLTSTNPATGKTKTIKSQNSNVLQIFLEDGSKISIRPSGTEPKIKFYISVNTRLKDKSGFGTTEKELDQKIENIIADLGL